MSEEEEGEKGTFGETVMGLALLGVLCFTCAEMFVADAYGVMIGDGLYAIGIAVVAAAIAVGLKWKRREEVKDD